MDKQLPIKCEDNVPDEIKTKLTKEHILELEWDPIVYYDDYSNPIPALYCKLDGCDFYSFFNDRIGFDIYDVVSIFDTCRIFDLTEDEYNYFKLKNER